MTATQSYKAPLDDIRFVLHELLGIGQLSALPVFAANGMAAADTVNPMLETMAAFAENTLLPLNVIGDKHGCVHDPVTHEVKTPPGFKAARDEAIALGLVQLAYDEQYGGYGAPMVVNLAASEMIISANMSYSLYDGLTHGAYTALVADAPEWVKDKYLPKMASGDWTATMCLTEPNHGSDLGPLVTKAEEIPGEPGAALISGTKCFISAGKHDLVDPETGNILHLVLARKPGKAGALENGTKGIGLYLVPEYLVNENNERVERNALHCSKIEDKMGIKANATAVMQFEGAKGYLVGDFKTMLKMMKEERIGVGEQGLALAETAYQMAEKYAEERKSMGREIVDHMAVREGLLETRAMIEGGRALTYWSGMLVDIMHHHPDPAKQEEASKLVDLITPSIKADLTDMANRETIRMQQVFGGAGFIKDSGMELLVRDSCIPPIYEGTNIIQSLDFLTRKTGHLPLYLEKLKGDLDAAQDSPFRASLIEAIKKMEDTSAHVMNTIMSADGKAKMEDEGEAVARNYLSMFSLVLIGHMWLNMASVAQAKLDDPAVTNRDFYEAKLKTAQVFFDRVLGPDLLKLEAKVKAGAKALQAFDRASMRIGHGDTGVAASPTGQPQRLPPAFVI